ncbi:hypothetical protein [Thalassiella azotivora]
MTLVRWTVERESTEWVGPLQVALNGTQTSGFEVALVRHDERPDGAGWAAPVQLGTGYGHLVAGHPPGLYVLWVRVTSDPEVVVMRAAFVEVT